MGSDDGHPHAVDGLTPPRGRGGRERPHRRGGVGKRRSRAGPGTTPAGTIRPRHVPSRRCRRAPLVRAGGPLRGGVHRGLRARCARPCGGVRVLCRTRDRGQPERRAAVRARCLASTGARVICESGPQRDRGGRDHRRRRGCDDDDERLGEGPARPHRSRSGRVPRHRKVARRARPAPGRRGRGPVCRGPTPSIPRRR